MVVCSRAGFILAPGTSVQGTNMGATWENRNDYCTSNGLTRCLGCTGASCEPASNGYGYTVWYNLPSAAAGDYTVTVTDGTATGAAVNVYRNQDGTMNSLIPVRGVGWGGVGWGGVGWGGVGLGVCRVCRVDFGGWLCVTHCVLLCAVCCVLCAIQIGAGPSVTFTSVAGPAWYAFQVRASRAKCGVVGVIACVSPARPLVPLVPVPLVLRRRCARLPCPVTGLPLLWVAVVLTGTSA